MTGLLLYGSSLCGLFFTATKPRQKLKAHMQSSLLYMEEYLTSLLTKKTCNASTPVFGDFLVTDMVDGLIRDYYARVAFNAMT
jgi:hypothetical protein